jgi:hypothetical protein
MTSSYASTYGGQQCVDSNANLNLSLLSILLLLLPYDINAD